MNYPEQSYEAYPTLRRALAPELAELSDEDLECAIESLYAGELSAEELESIWKGLSKAGKSLGRAVRRAAPAIGSIAQKALPVVGTVAGTMFGGPLGATLGGAAGHALGGALSGKGNVGQRVVAGLTRGASGALSGGLGGAAGTLAGALTGARGGGSAVKLLMQGAQRAVPGGAATRLMQTLARPETLKALTSMALGPAGRSQIPVAGTQVPVAAFSNLLGVLANQAAAEQHRLTAGESTSTPAYLLDDAGEMRCDASDATARAEVLFERLAEAEAIEQMRSAESDEGVVESYAWEIALAAEEEYWNEFAAAEAEVVA